MVCFASQMVAIPPFPILPFLTDLITYLPYQYHIISYHLISYVLPSVDRSRNPYIIMIHLKEREWTGVMMGWGAS